MLRLVKHHHAERLVEIGGLEVALQKRVRGDHKVVALDRVESLGAVRTRHHEALHPRRELLCLGGPVLHKRRGAHNECWLAARLGIGAGERYPRESLQRLAKAHLVRQQSRKAAALEEAHPVDALLLVGP